MRRILPATFAMFAGALLLAACGSSTSSGVVVSGTPSLSLSVPLTSVGCTTNDTCYAVGTTGVDSRVTTAAQYSDSGHAWHAVAAPPAPLSSITASSCWSTGCLFGGTNENGADLLWSVADHGSVTTVASPARGAGVLSISCYATATCTVLDQGADGSARLSATTNAGATWSTPTVIHFAAPSDGSSGSPATALGFTALSGSCLSSLNCVVAGSWNATGTVSVEITEDGGVTWMPGAATTWTSLSDLRCQSNWCVARAVGSGGQGVLVTSSTDGESWTTPSSQDGHTLQSLACVSVHRCAAITENGGPSSRLAISSKKAWSDVTLRYVPNALVSIACGDQVCAAVSAQSVVSIGV